MLYPKNETKELSRELFANPTSEYRGAPFWAWNGKLDEEEILRQTAVFKEMGFGGYFMHVRTGLQDEYLGEKFMNCIRACVDDAKKREMLAWLYDEDRWPSGFGGGLVTENRRYRQRFLRLSPRKMDDKCELDSDGKLLSGRKFLAKYRVFAPFGKLVSYRRVGKDDEVGCCWYAYLEAVKETPWYNNKCYVDTLSKEAIEKFADITYGAYKKKIGDAFGNVCPAMFTDEPQFYRRYPRAVSMLPMGGTQPWTDDFDDTFAAEYGYSMLDRLPELFWQPKAEISEARYDYYNHLSERFATAFADTLGKRCEQLGLKLTGHLMEEPTLSSQTNGVGDAMRSYRGFGLPGIDILCNRYEYTTAKQTQSAVRQYGKEGMLSELYGVSRWDMDFKNYKIHGDWQAALGVTIRVPHLSLMSMKGEAKRDYPASIFYQSSWYKKFSLVETHFARVNTALTRGAALTDIAVIHPIESFWTVYGAKDTTGREQAVCNERFTSLTEWLVKGGLDFDFISEALLPTQCERGGCPLAVGKMKYKVVLVPNLKTIRKTTLDRLVSFAKEGGQVIFAGEIPAYVDVKKSNEPAEFASKCTRIPFEKSAVLASLEKYRLYGVYENGTHTENTVCQLREDNNGLWLFVARAYKNSQETSINRAARCNRLTVRVKGEWQARLWNTLGGTVATIPTTVKDGFTSVEADVYNNDSLLIRYEKAQSAMTPYTPCFIVSSSVADGVPYTLDEPNALLLDRAEFSLDGKKYSKKYEILRGDNVYRKRLNMPPRGKGICQPWAAEKIPAKHKMKLRFEILSEIEVQAPKLALEDADSAKIVWNGTTVCAIADGWYVDKAISTVPLPCMKKGKNILEIELPFGHNTNLEWCYLLGGFGVKQKGSRLIVTELPKTLKFSDLTTQGLPFYGGKLTYHTYFEGNGEDVRITVADFDAPVLDVTSCGETRDVAFAPYFATVPSGKGRTALDIGVYLSRQNSFGIPHFINVKSKKQLIDPSVYHAPFFALTKRYVFCPCGIFTAPTVSKKQ